MYHSVILEDLLDIKNIHNRYSKKLSINFYYKENVKLVKLFMSSRSEN